MKKVLVFIKDKDNKFLLLKGSDNDPQFHESFWYTVTGSKEDEDINLIETVKREVKEETNLDAVNIEYLNWILKYNSLGKQCEEYVFICGVDSATKIILNEESVEYKWCDIDKFVNIIKWYADKNELRDVLCKSLIKQKYFETENTTQCD